MDVQLTSAEQRAIVAALDAYRRIKGAEGKLAVQRLLKADKHASERLAAQYAALDSLVTKLHKRLSETTNA